MHRYSRMYLAKYLYTSGCELGKGRSSVEDSEAPRDLKDLISLHQSISVALGMSLQHLDDSLFCASG